mgnify:CR=1 FL=1
MAHIKVVRRSMRPEEWNDLRFGWLKRYIINDKLPIDNIVIKDARQVTENNYEFYSDEFRPLKKGDLYFTPDGTAFIKAETEVPDSLKNKELWQELYALTKKHKVEFIKVKGHADNEFNNRCDEMAREAISKL